MSANFAALDALYPLPPAELSRQWALTRRSEVLPGAWPCLSLRGWHLAAHPDTSVYALRSRDGVAIGWLIEPLAYLGGESDFAREESGITLPVDAEFTAAQIDRALYGRDAQGSTDGSGFVGSWTAVLISGSGHALRLYLGPTHSVVYSPEEQIVATTHNLIPGLKRDIELSEAFDPIARNSYYTFGLTAFVGLHRLLPNHRLDLSTFQARRHWPLAEAGSIIEGPVAAARIVEHARRVLDALADTHASFKVPLSAGRDSRAILACLRPFATDDRIAFETFTASRPNLASQTDVQAAKRLSRIAGISHQVVEFMPRASQRTDIERAFVRLGESKCGPNLAAPAREKSRPPAGQLNLPGMAGETARAFYWRSDRPTAADLEPSTLVRRTSSPVSDRVVAAAISWLEGLPAAIRNAPCDALDLAYIEQRMGCWESSSRYLFPGRNRANLSLMATTLCLETMLRLPREYRAAGLLQRDMVAYGWPELLAPPFNRPVGALRLRAVAQKLRAARRRSLAALLRRLPGSKPLASSDG